MTVKEKLNEANVLAGKYFQLMGWEVTDGLKFYESTNPRHQHCWTLAKIAYLHLFGTDLVEVLMELEDESEEGDRDEN